MSMFDETNTKGYLIRGIEILANPVSLLDQGKANEERLFSDQDRSSLELVDQPTLLKLAQLLERKHEQAVNFTNMAGRS